MNDRLRDPLGLALALDADDLAAVRVDRARSELRRGRPVALQSHAEPRSWLLAEAIETLADSRLQALRNQGEGPARLRLLLSAERLEALEWPGVGGPLAFTIGPDTTLQQLRSLAALEPGGGERAWLGDAVPADAAMRAALTLIKGARLIPALLVAEAPAYALDALVAAQVCQLSVDDVVRTPPAPPRLRRVSDAQVPIAAHEHCELTLFREAEGDAEHLAIVVGRPDWTQPMAVRLHSSCLTGDLLGSLRCDCGDQLRRAIEHLAVDGGVLLYLAQEGRGTGLANKLRAYRLQDGGLDTLAADRHLGFRDDERDFRVAASMLDALGIARIRLLTNNPHKIAALREAGIDVVGRVPLVAPVNRHNARYVQTKRDNAGHLTSP